MEGQFVQDTVFEWNAEQKFSSLNRSIDRISGVADEQSQEEISSKLRYATVATVLFVTAEVVVLIVVKILTVLTSGLTDSQIMFKPIGFVIIAFSVLFAIAITSHRFTSDYHSSTA